MHDLLLILILLLVLLTLISLLGGSIYQDQSYLSALEGYFREQQSKFRPMEFIKGMLNGSSPSYSASGSPASASTFASDSSPAPSEGHLMGGAASSAASNAASVSASASFDQVPDPPSESCCRTCGNTSCAGCSKSASTGRVWWTAEGVEDNEPSATIGFATVATGGAKQRREKGTYARF